MFESAPSNRDRDTEEKIKPENFFNWLETEERKTNKIPFQETQKPYNPVRDGLLMEHEGDGFIAALSQLSHGFWSRDFLHGSDVMISGVNVVQKALKPTEKITEISKIKFLSPMKNNLWFIAGEENTLNALPITARKPKLKASFRTNTGRSIALYAYESRFPTSEENFWFNKFTTLLTSGFGRGQYTHGRYYLPLNPYSGEIKNNIGFTAGSILEIATCISDFLKRNKALTTNGLVLVSEFSDIKMTDMAELAKGGEIEVEIISGEISESEKFIKTPIRFTIISPEKKVLSSGKCVFASPKSKETASQYLI